VLAGSRCFPQFLPHSTGAAVRQNVLTQRAADESEGGPSEAPTRRRIESKGAAAERLARGRGDLRHASIVRPSRAR